MRIVLVLLMLVLASMVDAERIWEQGRDKRVHSHHRDEFVDEPAPQEDEEVDLHGGIPVVEDDVPEWVKLTFADKFIAMGESEFIELGDDVQRPDEEFDDAPKKSKHHHHHHHHSKHADEDDASDDEYEYFYSDDEGFEFDPSRDKIVSDPKAAESASAEKHRSRHADDIKIEDENTDEDERKHADQDADDDDAELVRAVKAHRARVDQEKANQAPGVPIAVPVNGAPSAPANSISMLEVDSSAPKSHNRGSRRAARQSQHQINKHHSSISASAPPVFKKTSNQPRVHLSSRYAGVGGPVNLNAKDPRLVPDDVISMIEQGSDELKLIHEESGIRAKNHKEWLEKHAEHHDDDEETVKLPTIKKHMYSSGVPVADWEVGYVDTVLKQFGY